MTIVSEPQLGCQRIPASPALEMWSRLSNGSTYREVRLRWDRAGDSGGEIGSSRRDIVGSARFLLISPNGDRPGGEKGPSQKRAPLVDRPVARRPGAHQPRNS